jgi:hypothetical protein
MFVSRRCGGLNGGGRWIRTPGAVGICSLGKAWDSGSFSKARLYELIYRDQDRWMFPAESVTGAVRGPHFSLNKMAGWLQNIHPIYEPVDDGLAARGESR